MKLLVITNAPTLTKNGTFEAYAPYVTEMNLWFKYADEITILSPNSYSQELFTAAFLKNIHVTAIPSIAFTSIKSTIVSLISLPLIIAKIFLACHHTDHIHLRCPGNIGMLGCFVQVFFPKKIKTAKYAGNWDPIAIQPLSYKIQKKILSNTLLTKRMTVLVYGNWKNQTKNIKSFFTATFKKEERLVPKKRDYLSTLNFVFVGSLVEGKQPLLAIQIVEELIKLNYDVTLDLYGDGSLKPDLIDYTVKNNLTSKVKLLGNQEKKVIKEMLKKAHFLILPSRSEGWPKAVAEAMFFGTIPISTSVSCVSYMLDYGKRGILIEPKLENAIASITNILGNQKRLESMSVDAVKWSQNYTLETFESEIIKLLKA